MSRICPTYSNKNDFITDLRKPKSLLDLVNMILRRFRLVLVKEIKTDDKVKWRLRRWLDVLDEIHEQGKCNVCAHDVEIVRRLMEEMLTLVFSTLAWAEAGGVSLSEANRKLEQAVCEKYCLGHETILGLVAKDALRQLGESEKLP